LIAQRDASNRFFPIPAQTSERHRLSPEEDGMNRKPLRIDTLIEAAANGSISRRDLVKRAAALGLGAPMIAALLNVSSMGSAVAQAAASLSFDAAATGGGGGKPNAATVDYSYIVNGGSQFELNRMVDARLVTLTADLQTFVGDAAESWDISGTTATFKLRKNVKWHDGTTLTSKDVAFTLNVLADPSVASRWSSSFKNIEGYKEAQASTEPAALAGIATPDDQTVVLTLTQPDSGLLAGLIFINILPEHILGSVARADIVSQPFWTKGRIGAGPFKFVQLVEGERVELEAFADYHLGAPKISKLNLLFFTSFETSLAAFQQGTNLVAPFSVNDVAVVKGISGADVATTPAGVGAIWINVKQTELSDKRVRQAMAYAIDKKTICTSLFQGYADPVSTEIPYLKWAQPADANPYDYDPDKAKSLLAEAGWKNDKTYTLWYYYPDQVTATVMEAIQQYLAAVGIKVELRFDDGSGVRSQQQKDGTWEFVYGSNGALPTPAGLTSTFGPPGLASFGYSNDAFNAEMDAALKTYDQAEQATHYKAAVKILNEDSPWIWLFDRKNLIAVNTTKLTTGANPAWGPGSVMYENHAYDWTVTG
jgi:peptide/nickel transport system substrate-binding protein